MRHKQVSSVRPCQRGIATYCIACGRRSRKRIALKRYPNFTKSTIITSTFDHPRRSALSVCLCMYVCQTITFESLDVGSLYLQIRYISREYGLSSYMKVIESRSRSQEQKNRKSLFPQCKTLIGSNSGSIKHRSIKFACSMGFSAMADRMV